MSSRMYILSGTNESLTTSLGVSEVEVLECFGWPDDCSERFQTIEQTLGVEDPRDVMRCPVEEEKRYMTVVEGQRTVKK